jgi:hypothetical protein
MQLLPPPVGSLHCVRGTQNAVFAPSFRFPPLREGNRAEVRFPLLREGNQKGSVPPACRGNLQEGVRNFAYFQTPSVLERAIL